MKNYIFTPLLFFLCLFVSCEYTAMGDTDLNFSIETTGTELNSYIGKPAVLKLSLAKVDEQNNYPFTLDIDFSKGTIEFDGKEYTKASETLSLAIDDPEKELQIKFTPSEIGEHKITLTFKNELVKREKEFTVDCSRYLYTLRTENIPEKIFVDKIFNFDLLIEEAENTQSDSIFAYAKLMKGRGVLKYGNSQLNTDEDTKTRILIGRNQLSFLPQTDGENIIRFFVVNKWKHETTADITFNTAYPVWNIKTESDTILIPLKEDFSFNVRLEQEANTDETEYISSFRFASTVQDYAMTINSNKVVQGKEFVFRSGTNIISIKANEAGTGYIEFFSRDKYKQEKTKKLFFEIKLPVRPIEASLDNTSIGQYENEKATFKLTVSEKNYFETFLVRIDQLNGKGIFTTGKEMQVSTGTHEISYVPDGTGTHTFKVTITDNNHQSIFLNGTVQVEKNPLITVNPTEGGTTTGGGSYKYNTDVVLSATAKAGYSFTGWYENDAKVSDSQNYNFVIKGNRVLEAQFTANRFNVIVNAQTGGAVSGSGAYNYNTNCTVKATAGSNYTFAGWYEGTTKVSSSAEYTFKVLKETTLEARFTKEKYTLSVSATVGGTATGGGVFEYGAQATVTATAETGYSFEGWYENGKDLVSSAPNYTFSIEGSMKLEARFSKNKITVTVNATAGGTVTGTGVYEYGTFATLKATAEPGYTFSGWYENGKHIGASVQHSYKVEKTTTIEARFTKQKYTLSVSATAGGEATGSGVFEYGTQATVTATTRTGYSFAGWYENGRQLSTAAIYLMDITQNTQLEARFTKQKYTLTVTATAGGEATGSGSYEHGAQATVKATPQAGYSFTGWYEDGRQVSNSGTFSVDMTKNTTLEARFAMKTYTVSVSSQGADWESTIYPTGSKTFNPIDGLELQATIPTERAQEFIGWYDQDGKQLSTNMHFTLKNGDGITRVVGKFETKRYTVSFGGSSAGYIENQASFRNLPYGTRCEFKSAHTRRWDSKNVCTGKMEYKSRAQHFSIPFLDCDYEVNHYK